MQAEGGLHSSIEPRGSTEVFGKPSESGLGRLRGSRLRAGKGEVLSLSLSLSEMHGMGEKRRLKVEIGEALEKVHEWLVAARRNRWI